MTVNPAPDQRPRPFAASAGENDSVEILQLFSIVLELRCKQEFKIGADLYLQSWKKQNSTRRAVYWGFITDAIVSTTELSDPRELDSSDKQELLKKLEGCPMFAPTYMGRENRAKLSNA